MYFSFFATTFTGVATVSALFRTGASGHSSMKTECSGWTYHDPSGDEPSRNVSAIATLYDARSSTACLNCGNCTKQGCPDSSYCESYKHPPTCHGYPNASGFDPNRECCEWQPKGQRYIDIMIEYVDGQYFTKISCEKVHISLRTLHSKEIIVSGWKQHECRQ